jgi:hypothetical protein
MHAYMEAHIALASLITALDTHRDAAYPQHYQAGQTAHVEAFATKLEALHRWFTEE